MLIDNISQRIDSFVLTNRPKTCNFTCIDVKRKLTVFWECHTELFISMFQDLVVSLMFTFVNSVHFEQSFAQGNAFLDQSKSSNSVSCKQRSLSIPSENIRKPEVFLLFGV